MRHLIRSGRKQAWRWSAQTCPSLSATVCKAFTSCVMTLGLPSQRSPGEPACGAGSSRKKEDKQAQRYLLKVQSLDAGTTRIFIENAQADADTSAPARHILQLLRQQLH